MSKALIAQYKMEERDVRPFSFVRFYLLPFVLIFAGGCFSGEGSDAAKKPAATESQTKDVLPQRDKQIKRDSIATDDPPKGRQPDPPSDVLVEFDSHDFDWEPPAKPLFRRLKTDRTGINFQNTIVETEAHNILTYSYMYNGGGVAVGDINNDGLPDLFFTSNQGANALYLNLGDMRFQDISESSGIAASGGWHAGVNMVDINEDGWLDIYVCRSGPGDNSELRKNLLYINQGDLRFEEQASALGIADDNHSTQASFFDFDQDGDLDLYVMNHPVFFGFASVQEVQQLIKNPELAKACSDNLYRNEGDGKFTRITSTLGLQNLGYGLGLITADLNGDGWTDIYVANDFSTPDFMYINQGDGTFVNELKTRTRHISYFGMGCDQVDINRDLKPDLVVMDMTANDRVRSKTLMPSMSPERFWGLVKVLQYPLQYMFNTLQLNQGDGQYSEIGLLAGIAKTDWSWAVLGADLDHDGWEDLLVTNGFRRDSKDNDFLTRYRAAKAANGGFQAMIEKGMIMEWVRQIPSQPLQNYLFQNKGDLSFKNQSRDWGFHEATFSNGAIYADLDDDGDLDLVVSNLDAPAFVYENMVDEQFPDRGFVRVRPVDEQGVPVLNAKVTVVADGISQQKELTTCRGYQSSVEPTLHFGLGDAKSIDSIMIQWPDQTVTSWEGLPAGQTHLLKKAALTSFSKPSKQVDPKSRFVQLKDLINWRHQENLHNEYAVETLLPHSQSDLGPCVAVADVNGDGTEDLFLGASHGFAPELLYQTADGRFLSGGAQDWQASLESENVAAVFFDADGDGDQDLYVANGGGSEFAIEDARLCDQFFVNEGGGFKCSMDRVPAIPISSGTVVPIDFDSDGDLDLFVGGRSIPGKYPYAEKSVWLENNGGKFTELEMPDVGELGMVNDALATDFDGDGAMDLICLGEWTTPQFLRNNGGRFAKASIEGTEALRGWWFDISEVDVNADGQPDYLLGNLGKNNKFKSKSGSPLKVLCNDFDSNGTFDIVLATEIDGRDFPVRGKECSTEQMPFLGTKFQSYHEFALADLSEMFEGDELNSALQFEVDTFSSCVLVRKGEGYERIDLPNTAQIAPIRDVVVTDLNDDGNVDVIAVGNQFNVEVETTRYDAGMGVVLMGNGDGTFDAVLSGESGFQALGDSRSLTFIEIGGKRRLVVANNNDQLKVFDLPVSPQNQSP